MQSHGGGGGKRGGGTGMRGLCVDINITLRDKHAMCVGRSGGGRVHSH